MPNRSIRDNLKVLPLLLAGLIPYIAVADSTTEPEYRTPPKILADIVDAPVTPHVRIDPTNTWMLFLEQPGLPPIEELAQPELRIGGLRINPKTSRSSRGRYATGLKLKKISGGDVLR